MTVEAAARDIRAEVAKAISGQERVVEQVLAAVLADGHVLLEGVPGVAKTLLVRCMAQVLGLGFGRVQFTPDLMPSDVLGTSVLNPRTNDFEFRAGPIFTSILLADEINRTPPKTQSALLEAMEERRVTVDGVTHKLPPPFLVFATQNPLDFEGTYPLPEAQQDRFLLKVIVDYPAPANEIEVLRRHDKGFRPQKLEEMGLCSVLDLAGLETLRGEVQATTVEEKIFDYIYGIVSATRRHDDLVAGASPRAGIALLNVSKAVARLRGRDYVIPDDVKELAVPVLRHRLLLRPESEVEGVTSDRVLADLLEAQTVPR